MEILILDRDTAALIDVIDEWADLTFTRDLYGAGDCSFSVAADAQGADAIAKGRVIIPDREASASAYVVEAVERRVGTGAGSVADDRITVTARSLDLYLAERIIVPPAGSAYDTQTAVACETAIKHYVYEHAGAGADAERQIPNLDVVASGGAGSAVTVAGRFQAVRDLIDEIGRPQGIGWEITLNLAAGRYEFDTVIGVDRSASVFFGTLFDSVRGQAWLTSDLGRKTVAYVAGQGEGVDRDVVIRPPSPAEGFERREVFIDARDIEQGETALLNTRGDGALAETDTPDSFEATVYEFGSFRYLADWDLGDTVLVRRVRWGIEQPEQIVRVTVSYTVSGVEPAVTVELASPWPNLGDALRGIGGANMADTADTPAAGGGSGASTPAGVIAMYGGASAPSGWLLCNGAAVSQTTYADLFTAIGHTFGNPGGGNFNLPDFRGRFPLGVNASHGLATTGGSLDHTHSTPAHTHPFTQASAHSAHVVTQPSAHSAHVFTQPSAHSAHTFTQPSAHTFTQPSAHSDHAHDLPFQFGAANVVRRIATATYGTGATQAAVGANTGFTADTTSAAVARSDGSTASLTHSGGAVSAHAGGAVDAHSAHAGGAVDGHSAHAGTAVDAHSAHAGASVDSGGASTSGTNNPAYLAVNYIIKA